MRLTPVYFLMIVFFGLSCNNNLPEAPKLNYDYNYFPLTDGQWSEYFVTNINIDAPSGIYDTSRYYIRQSVIGNFINNNNDTIFEILCQQKNGNTYVIQCVNTVMYSNNLIIETQDNIKYVKINLPVYNGKTWNGNIYNHTDTLNLYSFRVLSTDVPYQNNYYSFDSVITIEQRNKVSVVDKVYFEEKYARNIGLIYCSKTDIVSQGEQLDPSLPIEKRITRGYIYQMELIGYGKN